MTEPADNTREQEFNPDRFQIGDLVWVTATARLSRVGSQRRFNRSQWSINKLALITGFAVKYEGTIGHEGFGGEFTPTRTVRLWCFRVGKRNKEEWAFDVDVEPRDRDREPGFSFPNYWTHPWSDRARESASEMMKGEMASWPRDAQGRWLPTSAFIEVGPRRSTSRAFMLRNR